MPSSLPKEVYSTAGALERYHPKSALVKSQEMHLFELSQEAPFPLPEPDGGLGLTSAAGVLGGLGVTLGADPL